MGRKKASLNLEPLPSDLILFEILTRLPIKSLLRSKSVCKSWNNVISNDPKFSNLYFELQRQNNDDAVCELQLCTSQSLLLLKLNPFEVNEIINYPEYNNFEPRYLVGCSNGLVCTYEKPNKYTVWNPTTRARSLIWGPHYSRYWILCQGFGYSPSCDEYKIVILLESIIDRVRVWKAYTFSSKLNQWKRIDDHDVDLSGQPEYIYNSTAPAVQVGETLHWALWSIDEVVMFAFNLANNSIGSIPLPDPVRNQAYNDERTSPFNVSEIRQCLCVSWWLDQTTIQVWMLEQYGESKSWKEFFTLAEAKSHWCDNQTQTLLEVKDDNQKILFVHDDRCNLAVPASGCGRDQQVFAVVDSYKFPEQVTNAASYVGSLLMPFSPNRASRSLTGITKRDQDAQIACDF